jgi:hypothetical protein
MNDEIKHVTRAFRTGFRNFFPNNIEGLGITIVRASCVVSFFHSAFTWTVFRSDLGMIEQLQRRFKRSSNGTA